MQPGLRTTTRNQWQLTALPKNMAMPVYKLPSADIRICCMISTEISYEIFNEHTGLDILRTKLNV